MTAGFARELGRNRGRVDAAAFSQHIDALVRNEFRPGRRMTLSRIYKTWAAFALATVVVLGARHDELPAQEAGGPPLLALRAAATAFAPLPAPSLFSPTVVERIEQLAIDDNWPMPDELKPWPIDEQGLPIIKTRQVDELWQTLGAHETSPRRLRDMFRGDLKRIMALNPNLDFGNLNPGERVLVWQRDTDDVAMSIASANRGRIANAEPMPPGDNYVILYPHRSFGTYYTVSEITRVMDAYKIRYPDADPLIIGDLSFRTGGRIKPHKSHQSGRDVDITYPRLDDPPNYRRFHPIKRRNVDVEKALWLIKSFIDGGQVEYMFVDRGLQYLLAKEARRQGAPEEWIQKTFQYPHHKGTAALIRHARGHAKHFHVRFKCQETDRNCR